MNSSSKRNLKLPLVLSALLLGGTALADDRDAQNSSRIEAALAERIVHGDDTFTATTVDGVMRLTGTVASREAAGAAMEVAGDQMRADTNGIREIHNNLTVVN